MLGDLVLLQLEQQLAPGEVGGDTERRAQQLEEPRQVRRFDHVIRRRVEASPDLAEAGQLPGVNRVLVDHDHHHEVVHDDGHEEVHHDVHGDEDVGDEVEGGPRGPTGVGRHVAPRGLHHGVMHDPVPVLPGADAQEHLHAVGQRPEVGLRGQVRPEGHVAKQPHPEHREDVAQEDHEAPDVGQRRQTVDQRPQQDLHLLEGPDQADYAEDPDEAQDAEHDGVQGPGGLRQLQRDGHDPEQDQGQVEAVQRVPEVHFGVAHDLQQGLQEEDRPEEVVGPVVEVFERLALVVVVQGEHQRVQGDAQGDPVLEVAVDDHLVDAVPDGVAARLAATLRHHGPDDGPQPEHQPLQVHPQLLLLRQPEGPVLLLLHLVEAAEDDADEEVQDEEHHNHHEQEEEQAPQGLGVPLGGHLVADAVDGLVHDRGPQLEGADLEQDEDAAEDVVEVPLGRDPQPAHGQTLTAGPVLQWSVSVLYGDAVVQCPPKELDPQQSKPEINQEGDQDHVPHCR
mmetsp:Transcript_40317/g.72042  ORF Transcript_40317/g.72042 Transcript_40317/m.72042 type:complete len:508 (-) Transcript_40317:706-2229(-)